MPIPSAHHDTILLREHLYQDLKNRYLVIPPDAYKPGFKPSYEVGLGLFNYFLVNQEQLKTCQPPDQIPVKYNDFLYRDHDSTTSHSIFDIVMGLCFVSLSVFILLIVIRMIQKSKLFKMSKMGASKKHGIDLKSYSISDYLEKGDFSLSPLMNDSPSFPPSSSQPSSLVNSPSTPSNLMSSPDSNVPTALNTPVNIVYFDHSFGTAKQQQKVDPSLVTIADGLKIN